MYHTWVLWVFEWNYLFHIIFGINATLLITAALTCKCQEPRPFMRSSWKWCNQHGVYLCVSFVYADAKTEDYFRGNMWHDHMFACMYIYICMYLHRLNE